ncbi:hypothetical protein TTHERM_00188290 (macronuclear) [Tetrahymena thermophila SB210]|uniref:Uncharacterized protein n=1 Tax=Tetrahymena thermophila (strain SB210) TaxID=312017 RepID=I7MEF5_TETTS|nr:hypothetical protein TTHERM_00188290 [Tetrahymena thermophila SB210]EAR96260.2 hypothetical protein TTHERM_00188290 [Tetrahymena thermophila SB210]|eukprot:XP_001016505.2 hypothetical protein TTHERM_00188290 [Tetrahymena thermophila SB210]
MNYMESSDEYIELNNAIHTTMSRISEIDKITSELALEKLNLQKKLEQLKLQIQNIPYHTYQNGRTFYDEYENNQLGFMNNGIDNYSDFPSMACQFPYYNRAQNLIQNNGNANSYYTHDQAMINDHVDDYFDTDFNQKMYYQQQKQVSNEKFSSFNNLNQDNHIIENNLQLSKEDLTKPFINNENLKLDHELLLPLNNNSQMLNTNSKDSSNNIIQNDNIPISIYQNNSQIASKIQEETLENQEQKSVQNNSVIQSKYSNFLQQVINPQSKQPSIESIEQQINKDQHEKQLSPSYSRQFKKNNKQGDLILQTPQQNVDDMLDYEKQEMTKQKGVSGFNKIKKEKNKHYKKNSASETIKLCKYNHEQNKKKNTKCFTKEQSYSNQDCLSQFENSFLQNIQNLNHDELISNNRNNQTQITQKNNVHIDQADNENSQPLNKLKEENIEKQKLLYLSQKKQFLETLPEDSLRFQYSKQLQYLQDINLGKSTSDENIEMINNEEQSFDKSAKKSQKSKSDLKQNNSQKQVMLEIADNVMNEQIYTNEDIQRMYQHFLITFNNNKVKYTKRGKGYYRYPSTLKMKVVEFSKHIKLIQIQKDTQISQETIRKWQKRYTEIPDQMVEYDFIE